MANEDQRSGLSTRVYFYDLLLVDLDNNVLVLFLSLLLGLFFLGVLLLNLPLNLNWFCDPLYLLLSALLRSSELAKSGLLYLFLKSRTAGSDDWLRVCILCFSHGLLVCLSLLHCVGLIV